MAFIFQSKSIGRCTIVLILFPSFILSSTQQSGEYERHSFPLHFERGPCRPAGHCAYIYRNNKWSPIPWDVPLFCVRSHRPYLDKTCIDMVRFYALEDINLVTFDHRAYPNDWYTLSKRVYDEYMELEYKHICKPCNCHRPGAKQCGDTIIVDDVTRVETTRNWNVSIEYPSIPNTTYTSRESPLDQYDSLL